MTTIHLNGILTHMQSGKTLDEALERQGLTADQLDEKTHKELERQMDIHNKAVSAEEERAGKRAAEVEAEPYESNGNN